MSSQSKRKNHRFTLKKILRGFGKALLWFFAVTIFWVLLYKFINPSITFLMVERGFERKADHKSWKIDKEWKNFDELSMNLKKAAIAGEDATFMSHHGFDFKAIEKAYSKNQKGNKVRGGSTISQQTAKNVFLWPGRSYIRKCFEAYFTFLMETLWSKKRILEVYLNVIEMGDGIYGAETASQTYFNKSANKLTKSQAALIVAVLPNPLKWSPSQPTDYIYHKQYLILRNIKNLERLGVLNNGF
ncbi:monofunctional biosynthetic peptidoglycan transglycosylase [Pedobacter psychrophilus]|uniref:Biosynthetic peptidoglycan transglycosylase n=1 Tax=Pedobacter psychrophilus TaxID=1826909 RepID=A0A179DJG8_9SPHI|nr:monofunctional biosynthetic peptidoglycan transglycosylase [Pedobacter psychrophilus]OAQ40573.1 monofunctional biosynthetic peptidoglycan transglycosylase [Pedobacter psychrophilus]